MHRLTRLTSILAAVFVLGIATVAQADGKSDYASLCSRCHGADAKGSPEKAKIFKVDPAKLNLVDSKLGKAAQVAITLSGAGKMPAYQGKLTKEQAEAVVSTYRK